MTTAAKDHTLFRILGMVLLTSRKVGNSRWHAMMFNKTDEEEGTTSNSQTLRPKEVRRECGPSNTQMPWIIEVRWALAK